MDKNIRTYLHDILQSINEIESYFDNQSKVFDNYINDIKLKRAVERNLEIIGEASVRIKKYDNSFEIDNINNIIATRNRIIHGYDSISDEIIWSIVINHIPKLKIEIEQLLI